ncbi:MAG TPA: PIG-L family deacetylase, partial [Polyangia bacterium]
LGLVALLLVGAAIALLWVRSLFREPGARRVGSLVDVLGAHSIVAVFAHPDDEIKVVGLLADAGARKGVAARLILAARGDGGMLPPGVARGDLARVRAAEARNHAVLLGLRTVEVWSYADGHLAEAPDAELRERVIARLRAWQPDVVVTFEPHTGFTAHPDHLRIGAITTAAFCALGGDAHAPRTLVYILAPRGAARVFGGARGRLVAEREPAPAWAVHVDPALRIRGWRTHASQAGYVQKNAHVPAWFLYRLYDDEHYVAYDRAEVCR